jgi:PIN domain nuclease of toxin-antitoxin system
MIDCTLDSSALIALLFNESGSAFVQSRLAGSVLSAINLAEVVCVYSRRGVPESVIRQAIDPLQIRVSPVDSELAYRAGMLQSLTRHSGLSLGDCTCLALAGRLGVPAITADRAWQKVEREAGVSVILIR